MSNGLTIREKRFVKGIAEKNLTPIDSARLAGYSPKAIDSYTYSTLLKRERIAKELEKYGLNDKYIFKRLKKNTKVSNDQIVSVADSNRALELALKVKGYLDTPKETESNNTNIYIKELKMLNSDQLLDKVNALTAEIETLK